MSGSEVR
ncbi:uncharacterized protein FTOL_02064 [Fusarium torulosum]|nr:uncharacterized protein FTOL_02064 [Fusarium torulosum]